MIVSVCRASAPFDSSCKGAHTFGSDKTNLLVQNNAARAKQCCIRDKRLGVLILGGCHDLCRQKKGRDKDIQSGTAFLTFTRLLPSFYLLSIMFCFYFLSFFASSPCYITLGLVATLMQRCFATLVRKKGGEFYSN